MIYTTSSNPTAYDGSTIYIKFDTSPFSQSERDALVHAFTDALALTTQTASVGVIEEWTQVGRDAS